MNVKAVIFDWDGTLIDSVDHIAESLQQAAIELGYPNLELEAYRDIVGLGMIEALHKLYPGVSDEEIVRIREGYAGYFFKKVTTPQNVFDGMADVVADIRTSGRGCSVATGKSRRGLAQALTTSGLGHHFDTSRCADETRSKPDPLMLEEILEFYGFQPEDAVMIGDTHYDLEMAKRIGMPAIGVEWGAHSREVLLDCQPHAVVNSVGDLRRVLGL
ncbi:MAG: HAD-IA family hydrolase [Gammaproteobacteria bacterium]|uniref:Pyrophosphatase PpaX n=1 Tax=Marinobacter litoralis TaxID=187981 RepID=A0A3M2RKT5_9GAMM|nr:HAD-IA family hydrolase [Marinobacter litoralis]MBR9870203.1 HAD-IA family hydrolase [Gammaproteobacteria bacterium]RMJ05956.1 Pyrophosphatase PpaX [Marinobacter litoralis]